MTRRRGLAGAGECRSSVVVCLTAFLALPGASGAEPGPGIPPLGRDARTAAPVYEVRASGAVRVGFGEADITPEFPVRLSYGRPEPTTGYYDSALVHALLIEVDGVETLLLEFDVIGIRRGDGEWIKRRVAEATGLDVRHMIVAATHNHSYPRTHGQEVRSFLADRATRAAEEAMATRFDARIGVGKTRAQEDLNLNRAELSGLANPLLYVLRVDDADGNFRGAMFNYGSHPTIFTEWSDVGQTGPDWPGFVREYVEARKRLDLLYERYQRKNDIATDPFIMFSGGAAGDQQPRRADTRIRGEEAPPKLVFMEKLGEEVVALLDRTETRRQVDLAFRSTTAEIPRRDGDSHETLLQALVLNDAVLATIPGELGVDLGYRYEAGSPLEKNMLITNADDYIGYIVPEHLALEAVTYQAKGVRFQPHYGVRIIDEALRLVDPDHPATPPLDPDTLLGSIAGTVDYHGENVVAVGVRRIPAWPNYTGGFWGQRTVADEDGRWRIDRLAPGTFYIYVAEADPRNPGPTSDKSAYEDLRTLIYGHPVTVRAREETAAIHFDLPPDLLDTDVTAVDLRAASLVLEGRTLRGALDIEGEPGDATIRVGLYMADLPYRKIEPYLAQPVLETAAGPDGAFRFESIPPGRYRIAAVLDVNRNGLVERRIDVMSRLADSPIIAVPGVLPPPRRP
ncbi:MAG: hypothetical protein R3314_00045 [Longimicrobiales bacterium]|nr:hypothetical protein [Longimicrobiales bacterium]